jgi:hypothetical protein
MISNKNLARVAGLLYVIVIATGLFAEIFVRQVFKVPGNALTTADNIQRSEMLFRLGVVADIVNFICGLPCVLIIYYLFKRINKFLLQLALIFVIIQTAIIAVNLLNQTSPLLILSNHSYLKTFQPNQLATLSQLSLNIQVVGYAIGLVFFGFYCLLAGFVIFKSKLIPEFLGILYMTSGAGYLINSFTILLSKGFENPIFSYVAIPIFIGELSLSLWLLIKGINNSDIFDPND